MSVNSGGPGLTLACPWRLGLAVTLAIALLAACAKDDPADKARQAVARGDDANAAIFLRSALQQQPGAIDLRLMFADLLERRYDRAGAEEQLRKALEYGGSEDQLVPRIALLMLDRSDTEALVRRYKDTRLTDPQADAALRGTVALALLSLKREEPARQQIEGAAAVPSVRLARAQLLVNEGHAAQALEALELEGGASPPPWWLLRAARRIAAAAGQGDLSLELIRRAQEAAPWNLGVVGEYGEALISAGRFDEADQVRARLAKVAPQLFWTQYLSALLHNRAGRIDEAHTAALAVLKVSPDHVGSALIAASAELRNGDLRVAHERLDLLVRRNPQLLPALRLLAQTQLRMGQAPQALDTVRRGLALAPGDAELLMLRGSIETAAGQRKEAVASFEKAAAVRPGEPDVLLALARARVNAGDREGARKLLDQLPALVPDGTQGARVVETALDLREPALARRIAEQTLARFPKDAQARLAAAAVQSLQGDAAGAWAATLAVLDDQARHGGALTALGAMARTAEQHKQLLARHAAALAAGGGGPSQTLAYANLLREEPASQTTPLAVLERGMQLYPTAVTLRRAMVEESMRTGDAARAIAIAENGASMANPSSSARELLAGTYARVGKTQQAAEVLRKLVSDFPQNAAWRLRLAELDAGNGRESDAKTTLRKLIGDRPFDPAGYIALARLEAPSNLAEALSVAQELGRQPEAKLNAMLLTGDVYLRAGKPEEALQAFFAAGKEGAVPAASLRSIEALDQEGRENDANRMTAQMLREYPDHPDVLAIAARRAQLQGRASDAVTYLQRLLSKAPNNPFLLNDLAWAQIAANQREAVANARRALQAMPGDPNVLDTLGVALARSGQAKEAATTLRAAVNLAPTRSLPRLHLADVLASAGDKSAAVAALQAVDEKQLSPADKDIHSRLKAALQ